ncbi:MAG: DUF1080 domain-containing protein [Pirellulales bacterium]|nr:DUF1080 domain-containing protein [Pirellulales bacterium]
MATRTRRFEWIQQGLYVGALLLVLAPGPAYADGSDSQADLQPADVDLTLQGEFVGTVERAPSKFRQIALQIRATGGGTFEAIQYLDGLPTRPARRRPAVSLIGKRHDDFLVLSGGPWAVLAQADHCLLTDRNGKRVGRLDRVHRQSPTLGARPPKHAVVLFDGSGTDQFLQARMTEDGLLMEGADLKPMFQDFNLHLEFKLPHMPAARDQGRANSGVYLQSRYEVQVLDSFAMEPVNNGCGGLYRFRAPDVNMCLPPLVWQTYDIIFTAPRWAADGEKLKNARITVWHNGVKVHNDVELPNKTGAGKPEEPTLLPIRLQDHGNPVRFRNFWLIDRGAGPVGRFPIMADAQTDEPAEQKDQQTEEKADKPAEEHGEQAEEKADQPAEEKSEQAEEEGSRQEPVTDGEPTETEVDS